MQVVLKEPEGSLKIFNIQKSVLRRIFTGREVIDLGDDIAILCEDRDIAADLAPNFGFGSDCEVYGTAVFAGRSNGTMRSLNSRQLEIIQGCFPGVPWEEEAEISDDEFVDMLIPGLSKNRGATETERESEAGAALSVREEETPFMITESIPFFDPTSEDPDELIDIDKYLSESGFLEDAYQDADEAESEMEAETDPPSEELEDSDPAVSDAAPEEKSAEPSQEESLESPSLSDTRSSMLDKGRNWLYEYLSDAAASGLSPDNAELMTEIICEKYSEFMTSHDEIADLVIGFVSKEHTAEEKNAYFRFVTSILVKSAGVREAFDRRSVERNRKGLRGLFKRRK